MNKNLLDISVTDTLGSDVAVLTLDCYNRMAPNLSILGNGTQIKLRHGNTDRSVKIRLDDGDECSFPYLEVSPNTAKELGLRDGSRYVTDFNGLNNTLSLSRHTVSQSQTIVQIDRRKGREPRITMGPSLITLLGMSGYSGSKITIRRDRFSCQAHLSVLPNEMSQELRLSPGLAAKLGFSLGEACLLQYSQTTKLLQFGGSAPMAIGDNSPTAATVFRPLRQGSTPPVQRNRSTAKSPVSGKPPLTKAMNSKTVHSKPKAVKVSSKVSTKSRSKGKKGSSLWLSRALKK